MTAICSIRRRNTPSDSISATAASKPRSCCVERQVLRSSVQLARREDWIKRNGPGADVVLSHPKLVETGLDLFDKGGAYNFPTLIFYQTGYNLFTMRAGHRVR